MAFEELTRDQFIAKLIAAGWTREDAEREWQSVQDDDESGYDGP